ncbi:PorH family porin [Corynebacterium sp. S7]
MDLSFIGDLLGAFGTFGENIRDFMELPAIIIGNLLEYAAYGDGSSALVDTSSTLETSSIIGGSSISGE